MPPGDGGWGARDVSPFLLILIFITTLGPFQFGYHLVCCRCSVLLCFALVVSAVAPKTTLNT